MTRVAVCSDSHNGKLHLERFALLCEQENVDRIFFLGDVVEDAKWLKKRLPGIPVDLVAGNCDMLSHEAREACVTVEGKRFLLVHGDRFGVKYGYTNLSYYAEESMADAALFGHTHSSFTGYVGSALLINPGALCRGSMCLMKVTPRDIVPDILDVDEWYNENCKRMREEEK